MEALGSLGSFGLHTVDLFASRRNTLLPRFFSRWLPDAAATDALSRSWTAEGNCYAHPLIIMIPKVRARDPALGFETSVEEVSRNYEQV